MSANDELQAHTCEKMLEFYGDVANNVAQGNSQDNVKKSHITTENKPKSEKHTQDVQKNCLSLTEQWKKGELKEGWYYIRNKAHSIKFNQMAFFMVFGEVSYWTNCKDEDVEEVLAPVPSYEEWQELKEFADYSLHNRDELTRQINFWMDKHTRIEQENQQLKELLKECRHIMNIEKDFASCHFEKQKLDELLTKIDNAIGEK